MKNIIFISLSIIIFFACSEPEPDLQLSNPEAFAFDIGDSWEVNASVKAMGFAQSESEEYYLTNLTYSVDLIDSELDTLDAIFSDEITENSVEELSDIILEAQLEIDSSFSAGNYKLIFHVLDVLSNQEEMIVVDFDLSK